MITKNIMTENIKHLLLNHLDGSSFYSGCLCSFTRDTSVVNAIHVDLDQVLHSLVSGSTLFTRRSRTLLLESWHERVYRHKPELTHICLEDFSILIDWTSPFPVLRVSVELFHFNLFFMEIPVIEQCRP